jgi:hypothetical protein
MSIELMGFIFPYQNSEKMLFHNILFRISTMFKFCVWLLLRAFGRCTIYRHSEQNLESIHMKLTIEIIFVISCHLPLLN